MRNKYEGDCFRCHKHVDSGAGHFQRIAGRWSVRCRACVGKGNDPLPLHVGPAVMFMRCGGREPTHQTAVIKIKPE